MTNAPKTETDAPQASQKPQQTPQPQNVKAMREKKKEPEVKPSEPEMVVIPLEEMEQQPRTQKKSKQSS